MRSTSADPTSRRRPGEVLWENGPSRLRACRHGALLYLTADTYVGRSLDLYGEYSELEIELFAQIVRPGGVAVDIGANIGVHTVALAQMVGADGAVVALEPQRVLFQCLCANVAVNGLRQVRTHHAAAGAAIGHVAVPQVEYAADGNFGGLSLSGAVNGERVARTTLDTLDLAICHFVKIDVEGQERDVLAGADGTIQRLRPVLYLENNRREQSPELIEWLLARDYLLYWHLPPLFNPDNYFANPDNVFGDIISANMLALPRERARPVRGRREVSGPDDFWRQLPDAS